MPESIEVREERERRSLARDRRRLSAVAIGVVGVLAVLAARVGFVAIVQGAHWKAAAAEQSQSNVVLSAERGDITDRNGIDLATDVDEQDVVVDPEQVDDIDYYAHAMSPVLGIDENTLRTRLKRQRLAKNTWLEYRVIAQDIDVNEANTLKEMAFPGISVVTEPARTYPAGSLASALIGRTVPGNQGPVGASGLEEQYNDILHGTSGMEVSDQADGVTIPRSQHVLSQAHPGSGLELTIDEGLQYSTEQSLLGEVASQNAKAGMAAVLDLKTGDVLAMASVEGGAKPHVGSATDAELPLTYTYSPGSVMKIVTVSKSFDSGCLQPTDHYTVPYEIPNGSSFTIKDDESHGTESWTPWDILTQSSNVGTAEIAEHCLTPQTLDAGFRSFGFGRKTGIDFNGEATGLLLPPSQYADSGLRSLAIGYSTLVTPMQMLDAYATIARGGVPIQPRLLRAVVSPNGVRHNEPVHTEPRVVSSTTATTMQQIFENVVRAGTGPCAAVPGYEVAGKTGTVLKLGLQGVKDPGGHFATFAGFAPANNPRLAAIVVLDDATAVYGGSAAAPAWSQIMGAALLRTQVPAVKPNDGLPQQSDQAKVWARADGLTCSFPTFAQAMHNRAVAAYAAAHPTTTTSSTTTPTTTAPKKTTKKGGAAHGTTTSAPPAHTPASTTTTRPTTAVTTTTVSSKPDGRARVP
ncbi:MAG TPA: penicillin-binding protein 2 [Acidimicrobiia bacterium]